MSPSQLANSIYNKYWDGYIPINVEKMIREMGYQIQESNEIDCALYTVSNEEIIFSIRKDFSSKRKRYVLAHLLGLVLMNIPLTHLINLNSFSPSQANSVDRKAQCFATCLLVPKEILDLMVIKKNMTNVNDLANTFDVSCNVIMKKLKLDDWL